mgnify:CR=1 FL=1
MGDTELMTGAGLAEFPPSMHRLMLDDEVRIDAFASALAKVIRPGDTVVDVGTGTGVLAFLAKKAGAKRKASEVDAAGVVVEFSLADVDKAKLVPELNFRGGSKE